MQNKMQICLKEKSYSIFFEKKLVEREKFWDHLLFFASSFVVITHTSLLQEVASPLLRGLKKRKIPYLLLSFPPGEKWKTRKTKEYLENQMLQAGIHRHCGILSLGGGIVSDMAGFVAATYLRSLPLILVPTTLLGMIDASIGGKNGVNTVFGKNTIGTFHQPKAVFIDPTFLQTLPEKEWQNGMVEMIKYALISDPKIFSILEEKSEEISQKGILFEKMIFTSIQIKKKIVEEDEKEEGIRRILSFGHTLGHAIESAVNYGISHGEAIFLGILGESFLSMKKNLLSPSSFERISSLFNRYGISSSLSSFPLKKVEAFLLHDKKAEQGVSFVLLKEIGQPLINSSGYSHSVEKKKIQEMLQFMHQIISQPYSCLSLS